MKGILIPLALAAVTTTSCATMSQIDCRDHIVAVSRSSDVHASGGHSSGLDSDDQRTLNFHSCRSAQGHKLSLLWLGEQFERGSALVEVNNTRALDLYRQAAADDPTNTAVYVPGINGAPGTVMTFANPGAKKGLTEAVYRVGLMYLEGRGTIQSTKNGIRWMERAERRGHAAAKEWLVRYRKKSREPASCPTFNCKPI